MSLARPWWLAGLILLLPLVVLHLRRPALVVREVSSLLVWERVGVAPPVADRRLRRPRNPWLLVLQTIALCAFVAALAGPALRASTPRRTTAYVLDGSLWMGIGTRLDDARAGIASAAAQDSAAEVVVVSAGAQPAVVYRGSAGGLPAGLAGLRPGAGAGDLAGGVALAAGSLGGPHGALVVLRAPESPLPAISGTLAQLSSRVIGSASSDQGLFAPSARCGLGPSAACEVVASVRNGAPGPRVDDYDAFVDGRRSATLRVAVPARSTSTIAFTAPAGSNVRLHLTAADALAADDSAWVTVPGPSNTPRAATVTLVGDPTSALALAQAFASVPGVALRLRTVTSYRRRDALASDLVVLDGYVPAAGLPPAPAVLLVAPPRLPGGALTGSIAVSGVSGQAPASDLLDGVDLASLSVDRGAAERLRLPATLDPLVWSRTGPLLAAGDGGRQRLAVLAFDPARSNLPQLPAFPILARNIVRWAAPWSSLADGSLSIDALPATTRALVARGRTTPRSIPLAGLPVGLTGVAPGRLSVRAVGPAVTHRQTLADTASLPAGADDGRVGPIDLSSWAAATVRRGHIDLTPWLLVLALAAMAGDAAYWRSVRA